MENIKKKVNQGFIEDALVEALQKSCGSDYYISKVEGNPFDYLGEFQIQWDGGYIAKYKHDSSGKNFQDCREKHVLMLKKIDLEWIKMIEKINFLRKRPKIYWWFGKENFELKNQLLSLLGEFRTVEITDEIRPLVSFYIETKKVELFHDFGKNDTDS